MRDLVTVKSIKAHDNAYGDKDHKAVDHTYEMPRSAFRGLEALGLVEKVSAAESDEAAPKKKPA